jgi:hypothetical protein
MKPVLKAPGTKRLKLESDEPLSSFAFKFNLRRYSLAGDGTAGFRDGPGAVARFSLPTGVAVDARGNVFVCDSASHCVRVITPEAVVSTLAGRASPRAYTRSPSAQLEPFLTQNITHPLIPLNTPETTPTQPLTIPPIHQQRSS